MPVTVPGFRSDDPLVPQHFALDFNGQVTGLVVSCDGLESKSEITDAHSGGQGGRERATSRTPGKLSFTPLQVKLFVLKTDSYFETWFRQLHEGGKLKDATRNGSIKMYDSESKVIAEWRLTSAWPSKIAYSDLDSDANDAMTMTVTIVYEDFERVQ
jgi:phage tail-like protein